MDTFYYLSQSNDLEVFHSIKSEVINLRHISNIEEVNLLDVDYDKNPPFVFVDISKIQLTDSTTVWPSEKPPTKTI